jgi:hypothetical protein
MTGSSSNDCWLIEFRERNLPVIFIDNPQSFPFNPFSYRYFLRVLNANLSIIARANHSRASRSSKLCC